jgi:4-carboxymuconolactone decarboxylase
MRLPHPTPAEMTPEQRQVYETIIGGPRRAAHQSLPSGSGLTDAEGRLIGPFNAMVLHPTIGVALQDVGRALRFDGLLTPRAREIVILATAADEQSDFEWGAHAAIAAGLGFGERELDAFARQDHVSFTDPYETAVYGFARAIVETGDAGDAEFAAAHAVLDDAHLIEISTIVGFYRLLAQLMRVFRVPGPKGPW